MSDSAAPAANANTAADSSAPREQVDLTTKQEVPAKPAKQIIDLDGEKFDIEQLKRERKKWQGADKAFREAAHIRETVSQREARLLENPAEFLSDPKLSPKLREWAENIMIQQFEAATGKPADPKDQELADLKQQLKQFQDAAKQQEENQQQEQYQRAVHERREAIAQTLIKALEATPFAKSPELQAEALSEMAKYMRICKKAGYEVSPEDLAEHVKGQRMKSFLTLVQTLEGEDLISTLGEDLVKRLRKADMARIRAAKQVQPPQVAETWEPNQSTNEKRKFVDPYSVRGGR